MGLKIAMVCDFFHPNVGGVESHIYMLGVNLMRRGHSVIVITHSHPPARVGIRWLVPGLKVYYLPFKTIASSATLPEFLTFLPYLRSIIVRERVQILHGHASLSSLAHEGIFHSHLMGVRTVFTDHSLFGFDDATGILTNKLLEAALRNVDAVICVSYTGRENTFLRAYWNTLPSPSEVPEPNDIDDPTLSNYSAAPPPDSALFHVIPNAIIADQFKPSSVPPDPKYITIVVISRLAYRKGVDLLVATAPRICHQFPRVRFIVGGDGPKLTELLQMREKHLLQDRIILRGPIRHKDVQNLLNEGSIFLNTSLTEAFGIAILEAACAGLYVVSTRVGGVPEVLPEDMVSFAKPDEDDVVRALSEAIEIVSKGRHDPFAAHERVRGMYDWTKVAARTELVYNEVLATEPKDLWTRLQRTLTLGPFAGLIFAIILAVEHLFFHVLEWWMPREDMDIVQNEWDAERFKLLCQEEEERLQQNQSTPAKSTTT